MSHVVAQLPTVLDQLAAEWRARAEQFRHYAAAPQAATLEQAARELEDTLAKAGEALLTLEEAAVESGYNVRSLRRYVERGTLAPALRQGRRLFFRARDLPRKPLGVDAIRLVGYDPAADARKVAAKRTHGDS